MFKELVEPWGQYIAKIAQGWAADDPRRDLNIEVVDRLFQLDMVLEYINRAIGIWFGDPSVTRRQENVLDAKSPDQLRKETRAAAEVRLFTETFDFFAWRLVEILTSKAFPFEGFRKLKAKGIRDVRHQLIQHPETYSKNFRPSLSMAALSGPVLKAMRLGPDKVDVVYDRGLFVNAQELHDEIIEILRRNLG
jgi:hypothetical protein